MNLKQWNFAQIDESRSSINRYFFWLKNHREPVDDEELLLFYVENGGARDFANKHKGELEHESAKPRSEEVKPGLAQARA